MKNDILDTLGFFFICGVLAAMLVYSDKVERILIALKTGAF